MNYSNDCGCAPAVAPKMIKTLSVAPAAATEEVVCPDVRCVPHLLNSLPETDDAVPNYVGVYKGQSYIAPIRALVDSVLMDSLNSMYRDGKVPTVVNYRDIESLPVIQKENCQKVAVTSMPTLAKAMMTALPAAPVGYEPVKVMTTDKEGDVYLATPVQVVSPGLIPAMVDNCEKGKIKNVPFLERVLGFGTACGEFGYASLKQLQESLATVVNFAVTKTLPNALRGYGADGKEYRYPVALNAVRSIDFPSAFGGVLNPPTPGGLIDYGKVNGPLIPEGLWIATINYSGGFSGVTPAISYCTPFMNTPLGQAGPTLTIIPGQSTSALTGHAFSVSKVVQGPIQLFANMYVQPGAATATAFRGDVVFTAQEISRTAIVVNDVK